MVVTAEVWRFSNLIFCYHVKAFLFMADLFIQILIRTLSVTGEDL